MHTANPEMKTVVGVTEANQGQDLTYEMRVLGVWHACSQGQEMPNGWLEFRTPEGKKGLAPFGTWRKVPPKT